MTDLPGTEAIVQVTTARALMMALSAGTREIEIAGRISNLPPLALASGQCMRGTTDDAMLIFDGDGVTLSADNRIESLSIVAPSASRSVMLDKHGGDRGHLYLNDLTCHGQVQIIFGDETAAAQLSVYNVAIAGADASARPERPHANGVDVLQGAMTIWNRSASNMTVAVEIDGLEIGSPDHQVIGTGLFISGNGNGHGGRIAIDELHVSAVHSNSGLPIGTTGTVAGGVFILQDVTVNSIIGNGSVITYGPNAVPIDNWGSIQLWQLHGNAISHGPSAIGFVNAGTLQRLEVTGIIETFGDGARGCGIYGPTGSLAARQIRTHGAAAIGVQVIASLDRLDLDEGIVTEGEPGEGLVKGVMIEAPAHGIHIEHGAILGAINVRDIDVQGRNAQEIFNEGRLG